MFNNNKSQLLNEKINVISNEKNNLQIKNDKLNDVFKKITEFLLLRYKETIFGNNINILIDSNLSDSFKFSKTKEKDILDSNDKKEIMEKIKNISKKVY